MEPAWAPARSPETRQVWGQAAPELAAAMRAEAAELARGITEQIREVQPELIADPEDAAANRASNEATLVEMAAMLERGENPYGATLPEPTQAWALDSARRGRSLPGLMRIYRIGYGYVWNWALNRLRAEEGDGEGFAGAVELISEWLLAYVDGLVVLAEEAYGAERERWLRSSQAVRSETIAAILAADSVDRDLASSRLGYDLGRHHLALIAWRPDPGEEASRGEQMEAVLRGVVRSLTPGEPLVHPTGALSIAAWIGSDAPIDPVAPAAVGFDARTGVRIVAGNPGTGIEGFRRSHREAQAAHRIAMLGERESGSVLPYSEVEFAATATGDIAETWRFVQRQIGSLADGDRASGRLRATLHAYLGQGCSPGRAAAELGIHENTVRYRVRQCEDRLGRAVGPGDFDLQAALRLCEQIPALAGDRPPR